MHALISVRLTLLPYFEPFFMISHISNKFRDQNSILNSNFKFFFFSKCQNNFIQKKTFYLLTLIASFKFLHFIADVVSSFSGIRQSSMWCFITFICCLFFFVFALRCSLFSYILIFFLVFFFFRSLMNAFHTIHSFYFFFLRPISENRFLFFTFISLFSC